MIRALMKQPRSSRLDRNWDIDPEDTEGYYEASRLLHGLNPSDSSPKKLASWSRDHVRLTTISAVVLSYLSIQSDEHVQIQH